MVNKIVVASTRREAGKTSIIIGLAKALSKFKIGYMKPLGDRLLYQKKRLWDYDSALITNIFNLTDNPEDLTLGFAHSKLKFMYDEISTKKKLEEMCSNVCPGKDMIFLEGSKNLTFGLSVYLDPLTVTRTTNSRLLLVLSGDEDNMIDDMIFLKKCVKAEDIDLLGVIINAVKDVEDFKNVHLDFFDELGVKVLGIIPNRPELNYFTMDYLFQNILSAKLIAGENGLQNKIEHIFVGAMSAAQVVKRPLWGLENKLIITPGDRHDMILASLESSTAGIVLTNGIPPEDPIIESKANLANIPILLVSSDTFATAKVIDDMDIMFTKDEEDKIDLITKLITENVDLTVFTEL